MNHSERIGRKLGGFCTKAVALIMLVFMCYLLPMSFFRTTDMSTGGGIGEIVHFEYDNFFLNIIMLLISICLFYLLWRFFETLSVKKLSLVMLGWVLAFGFLFTASAKLSPSEDSFIVTYFARQASRGDYSNYQEYFRFFPYQFGFVLYEELFFRCFRLIMPYAPEGFSGLALQGLNVVYTAFSYYAILQFVRLVFKSDSVCRLTIALFIICLPSLFFVTYMYGNVPSFACVCAALWSFASYMRHERWQQGLLCGVFLTLAVLLKLNSLIVVVAVAIVWLIRLVRKPRPASALLLALSLAMVLLCQDLPQRHYEKRIGIEFGDGIPMISWLAMGLHEGDSCSGWYDPSYTTTAYRYLEYDREATSDYAAQAISQRLERFGDDLMECQRFFGRKFLSQWNEPTYQGLWNNQLRGHYSEPGLMYELLCSRYEKGVKTFSNLYQQFVFFGFTLGLLRILRRRDMLSALLPLTVLGGMLYHLLFEAKSQHSQGYFLLMIPVAAYGLVKLFEILRDSKTN